MLLVLISSSGGGGDPVIVPPTPGMTGLVIVAELVLTLDSPPILSLELDTI